MKKVFIWDKRLINCFLIKTVYQADVENDEFFCFSVNIVMGHSRLESSRYQKNKLMPLFELVFSVVYGDNHSNFLARGETFFYFSLLIEADNCWEGFSACR
jgi:hypothetical protein